MLLQAPLRVEKCCPRLWSLAVAAGLLGVAVFASGIGLRAADPAPNDSAPVASAAPVDDRDPARKEDPNQAPPRRSEELRRAEEALNKALQNLPTEVDAEKIRKQVQEALEKVQRDLKKLETLHQPGQGLPTVGQRLQQLSAHHSPRVGLGLQSPSPVLSEQLNLPQGQGLVIVQVVPDSPAAKAGLRVNDILLEVNGKPVPSNWREVHRLFAGEKKVDMVVLRRGKRETVKGLVLPDESEEPRPGQRFGGGFPGGPGQPGAPGGLVPGAPPAPGAPAVGGRFGLPGTPPSPRLPAGGRFAPPDPNVPAPPGLPGAPGAGPGAGFGPNMVMTTVLRNNDRFTTRHQEGSLIISVTGTVADSKAKVGEIHIQDGGRAEKYESMDKVPQRYLDKVKNLVTMSEKGGTSR